MPKKPKPHELRQRAFRIKNDLERSSKPRMLLPERHLLLLREQKLSRIT